MALSFLEFEQPIAELEAKIDELRFVSSDAEVNIGEEIARLRARSRALTTSIFAGLTPWQVAQLARHPQRPYTLDYAAAIFEEFHELHGDRMYADDLAIVGGFARLAARSVTRRDATPRSGCDATTACRSRRATARRSGS
jgi:acetyl-CoA carboxylase carboxyl transferase subunit alpha